MYQNPHLKNTFLFPYEFLFISVWHYGKHAGSIGLLRYLRLMTKLKGGEEQIVVGLNRCLSKCANKHQSPSENVSYFLVDVSFVSLIISTYFLLPSRHLAGEIYMFQMWKYLYAPIQVSGIPQNPNRRQKVYPRKALQMPHVWKTFCHEDVTHTSEKVPHKKEGLCKWSYWEMFWSQVTQCEPSKGPQKRENIHMPGMWGIFWSELTVSEPQEDPHRRTTAQMPGVREMFCPPFMAYEA